MRSRTTTVRLWVSLLGLILGSMLLLAACAKEDAPDMSQPGNEEARMEKMKSAMQGMAGKNMKAGAADMKGGGMPMGGKGMEGMKGGPGGMKGGGMGMKGGPTPDSPAAPSDDGE